MHSPSSLWSSGAAVVRRNNREGSGTQKEHKKHKDLVPARVLCASCVLLCASCAPSLLPVRPHATRSRKVSSSVAKAAGSVRSKEAKVIGGNVVNFEKVRSKRKERATIGVLLVICILPTRGREERKNCDVNPET